MRLGRLPSIPVLSVLLCLVSGFTECYKPVTGTGLPKNIKSIAVPAFKFEAKGLRYRVESRFTEAVSREIIRRGSGLKVQGTLEGADAVVEGNIRDFTFSGVLLDREGRVVGAVFDGNIHSLGGEYFYDGALNRSVTVASTAIRTSLADVYAMPGLLAELEGR